MSNTRLTVIQNIARETATRKGVTVGLAQSRNCGYQDGPALFAMGPEGKEACVEIWPARQYASLYAVVDRGGELYATATDEAGAADLLLAAVGAASTDAL